MIGEDDTRPHGRKSVRTSGRGSTISYINVSHGGFYPPPPQSRPMRGGLETSRGRGVSSQNRSPKRITRALATTCGFHKTGDSRTPAVYSLRYWRDHTAGVLVKTDRLRRKRTGEITRVRNVPADYDFA